MPMHGSTGASLPWTPCTNLPKHASHQSRAPRPAPWVSMPVPACTHAGLAVHNTVSQEGSASCHSFDGGVGMFHSVTVHKACPRGMLQCQLQAHFGASGSE